MIEGASEIFVTFCAKQSPGRPAKSAMANEIRQKRRTKLFDKAANLKFNFNLKKSKWVSQRHHPVLVNVTKTKS